MNEQNISTCSVYTKQIQAKDLSQASPHKILLVIGIKNDVLLKSDSPHSMRLAV
jgi:hypothetical protein